MVRRLFVTRKSGFRKADESLLEELKSFLGIQCLVSLQSIQRYDMEGLDDDQFEAVKIGVFSEIQTDMIIDALPDEGWNLGVEMLSGQFDQRSDSAETCIRLLYPNAKVQVRSAVFYCMKGKLDEQDKQKIVTYLVNPVEAQVASVAEKLSLERETFKPDFPPTLVGFSSHPSPSKLAKEYGLAMDEADLKMVQSYFSEQGREPTLTELRVLDTYWSDHCRHTTFLTELNDIEIRDKEIEQTFASYLEAKKQLGNTRSVTLMDLATLPAKLARFEGNLDALDVSEEINACSVKVAVDIDGEKQPWLLQFKNETHNHPTEIEPFGGAATCIGGAIRDPLSGRAYVYQAMRISGSADPRTTLEQTLAGKLPQKKIALSSAHGNSSYGNQIGLATSLVEEIYHPGFLAKHMEMGFVIAASPEDQVRRSVPAPGDVVVLVGGRTGRDGCGGATGSSKTHDHSSLSVCSAEVQKGNAPEERKLQRLLRNSEASKLIKRCNDFGAGGVSVAIGELADGLLIDLDTVPTKYDGLDGTELAISESQERMAMVLDKGDVERFCSLAQEENLETTVVAKVTDTNRLQMLYRGQLLVDIKRSFLDTHGAKREASILVEERTTKHLGSYSAMDNQALLELAGELNIASGQALAERFDSTIGAGTLLMPYGGTYQKTPTQVMAALLPVLEGKTNTTSLVGYGYDPYAMSEDTYKGAFDAVIHSIAKVVAAGGRLKETYLTFQEYFGSPAKDPKRWAHPFSALLGAYKAQRLFSLASIGGKDSMSGSFANLDVPPTLVSLAVSVTDRTLVVSNEFKQPGNKLVLLEAASEAALPTLFAEVEALVKRGAVHSSFALGYGGLAEALMKMSLGNRIGATISYDGDLQCKRYGAFLLEVDQSLNIGLNIGFTTDTPRLVGVSFNLGLDELEEAYELPLKSVFGSYEEPVKECATLAYTKRSNIHSPLSFAKPKVVIPVFPGTNCEYDLKRALQGSGAEVEILVLNTLDAKGIELSVSRMAKALSQAQMLFLSGGFSGGDEPDGSGKFIASFLRNPHLADEIESLLHVRQGLVGGICNGFQALVKLGLLPYGHIAKLTEQAPTLTFNTIGRHQSRLVRTRVSSTLSPWMSEFEVGDIQWVPISHGEGRFVAPQQILDDLVEKGQVASQYVDRLGNAVLSLPDNPNGSALAIEGLTSADGRVFGRMAHSERAIGPLYANTPYKANSGLFWGAVRYFS